MVLLSLFLFIFKETKGNKIKFWKEKTVQPKSLMVESNEIYIQYYIIKKRVKVAIKRQ